MASKYGQLGRAKTTQCLGKKTRKQQKITHFPPASCSSAVYCLISLFCAFARPLKCKLKFKLKSRAGKTFAITPPVGHHGFRYLFFLLFFLLFARVSAQFVEIKVELLLPCEMWKFESAPAFVIVQLALQSLRKK